MRDGWREVRLGDVVEQVQRPVAVAELAEVPYAGVRWYAEGVYARPVEDAKDVKAKTLNVMKPGDITYNRMWATKAAFGVADESLDGCMVTNDFPLFVAGDRLVPGYLSLVFTTPHFQALAAGLATGTTERRRLKERDFLSIPVDLPPLVVQRRVVDLVDAVDTYAAAAAERAEAARDARSALLEQLLMAGGDEWIGTTLGEVADYQNGYPFKPAELGGDGLPVIRIKQLLDARETPDRASIAVPERHRIADGDLVFSWSGTLAVRIWSRGPAALNQHLFRVSERPGVERRWLALALDHAIAELNEKTHGSTMRHITKANLLPHPVLLPPLPEQVRIVDLVNAAESEAERAAQAEAAALSLRSALLGELLSGDREVPESYDELVGLVA